MSRNRLTSLASEILARIRKPLCLSLEELVCRDGDDDFPRFRADEVRQRENHAIEDPADHSEDRQKTEQAGHEQASDGELTIVMVGDTGLTTNMFAPRLQESLARVSAGGGQGRTEIHILCICENTT